MGGVILIATITAMLEDPLLPQRWRERALGLSRDPAAEQALIEPAEDSLRQLGELIFHSNEFSGEGRRSCATCHDPQQAFQDQQTHPRGVQGIARDTPSLWGVAQHRWFGWDGRWDSLWAQALEPIETKEEMDSDRLQLLRWIAADSQRRELFEEQFGQFPGLGGLPEKAREGKGWTAEYLNLPRSRQKRLNRAFSDAGRAVAALRKIFGRSENLL